MDIINRFYDLELPKGGNESIDIDSIEKVGLHGIEIHIKYRGKMTDVMKFSDGAVATRTYIAISVHRNNRDNYLQKLKL